MGMMHHTVGGADLSAGAGRARSGCAPYGGGAGRLGRRGLVVDDSAIMRHLVSDLVASSGEFEVVGTARDGLDALRQIPLLAPDLITLDVDMPTLDGLACLDRIMREPCAPHA